MDAHTWYKKGYFVVAPLDNLIERAVPREHATAILPMDQLFPNHVHLQRNWWHIRNEALQNLSGARPAAELSENFFKNIATPKWNLFILKWYEKDFSENLAKCPITASLLAQLPEVRVAMFSIMDAGNYVPPHKGVFRGANRYHLALKTPEDYENCFIDIGGEKHAWKEGEDVLFDDSFKHSVQNNTNEQRIVLFMDVDRPLPEGTFANKFCNWISNSSIPERMAQFNKKQEKSTTR